MAHPDGCIQTWPKKWQQKAWITRRNNSGNVAGDAPTVSSEAKPLVDLTLVRVLDLYFGE